MSSEWPLVTFESLCDIKRGASPRPIHDWLAPTGVPWVKISDATASNSPFISKTGDFIKPEAVCKSVEVFPGDFILSNSATPGIPKFMQIHACVHDGWLLLRNFRGLDRWYCYYLLQTERENLIRQGNGSVFTNLKTEILKKHEVRLPLLSYQQAIAEFLRGFDERLILLRETNATLEAIAQALFKSWFVDFDPVRAKQEGRAPEGMDEATAALFPDGFEESELGLVPRGWSYVSLRDVVSIFDSKRIPLSGQERAKRRGPYPYYGAAALMDSVDDYLFDGIYLLMGEDGSVADTNGYPITQYVWGKVWVNNHAHVLQGDNGISTEHVMLSLKRTNIQPFITGAVQAKLSQSNLWRIMFLNPQREVAAAFSSIIEPLFKRIRHNSDQAQILATLRDTLLPRLISGQLRLPEAEAMIEEAV